MATDYYWSTGDKTKNVAPATNGIGCYQFEIDFGKHAVSAADVVQICNIAAGTRVLEIGWEVTDAEGATCTADLGDASDPNGWDDTIDLNSEAAGGSLKGTDARTTDSGLGYFYSTADTLDLTMGHDTDNAVITFQVVYITCENT